MDGKLGSFLQRLQKEISPTAARAEKAASKQQDTELLVEQLLLRNALFWHVTLLIESWRQRLPANRGLPVSERARLDKRIEAVQTVDPKWADANLVSGLIAYYFSMDNNAAREAALKQLRQYRENGGNLADIISLLEREQKVIESIGEAWIASWKLPGAICKIHQCLKSCVKNYAIASTNLHGSGNSERSICTGVRQKHLQA